MELFGLICVFIVVVGAIFGSVMVTVKFGLFAGGISLILVCAIVAYILGKIAE